MSLVGLMDTICWLIIIQVGLVTSMRVVREQARPTHSPSPASKPTIGPLSAEDFYSEDVSSNQEPYERHHLSIEEMLNQLRAKKVTKATPIFIDDFQIVRGDVVSRTQVPPRIESFTMASKLYPHDMIHPDSRWSGNIRFWWAFIAGCLVFLLATASGACYKSRRQLWHQHLTREDRLRISIDAAQALTRIWREAQRQRESQSDLLSDGATTRLFDAQREFSELPPSYDQAILIGSNDGFTGAGVPGILAGEGPPTYDEAVLFAERDDNNHRSVRVEIDANDSAQQPEVTSSATTSVVTVPGEETTNSKAEPT